MIGGGRGKELIGVRVCVHVFVFGRKGNLTESPQCLDELFSSVIFHAWSSPSGETGTIAQHRTAPQPCPSLLIFGREGLLGDVCPQPMTNI